MTEKYNGWTNHETWLTMLHINNDEYMLGEAGEIVSSAVLFGANMCDKDDELRDWFMDTIEGGEMPNLVVGDILTSFASAVNWTEITNSLLEDIAEVA